jgi:hypothetical protein
MRLCDHYALRKGFKANVVKRFEKSFLLYGQRRLLTVRWTKNLPSPGFYEIAECSLATYLKPAELTTYLEPNKIHSVSWDDYEKFVRKWVAENDDFVESKTEIFRISWEFFLKNNDDFFASNFDPYEILKTIDGEDWISESISLLGKIKNKSVCDFWWSKLSEIQHKYAFWICDLAKEIKGV